MDFLGMKQEVREQLRRSGRAEITVGYRDRHVAIHASYAALEAHHRTPEHGGDVQCFANGDNGYVIRVYALQRNND